MSITLNNIPLYKDARSPNTYAATAREYTAMWNEHAPDLKYYEWIRCQHLSWLRQLREDDSEADVHEGVFVNFGPGMNSLGRDLSAELISGSLEAHPKIVGADWSPQVLENFAAGIKSVSTIAFEKIVLTQRDVSNGIASRFHALISQRLECIRGVDDLRSFIQWVEKDVTLELIMKATPEIESFEYANGARNRIIQPQLEVDDPFDFQTVLKGIVKPVRFVTANMVTAGTLALTEKEVRQAIDLAYENKQISKAEYIEMHRTWHRLIAFLNTHITFEMHKGIIEKNPDANVFAPTDVNSCYNRVDTFPRLNVQELRSKLLAIGIQVFQAAETFYNDLEDSPPHTHLVSLFQTRKMTQEELALQNKEVA